MLELSLIEGAREALLVFAGEDVPHDVFAGFEEAWCASGRSVLRCDLANAQEDVLALPVAERELRLDDRRAMQHAQGAHGVARERLGNEVLLTVLGIGAQGTQAFLHACGTRDLMAACVLSMRPIYHDLTARKNLSPIDFTMNLNVPLLGLFTRSDERAPEADRQAFHGELERAFRIHTFHVTDDEGQFPRPTPANVETILTFLDEWAAED
ncbi:MAG: hypothetical protein H6834_06945 [Planctomycetes bacterium]|nr:hypothetical protein [Planctomycetota bacterium]